MTSFFDQVPRTLVPSPNGAPLWWHSIPLPDGTQIDGTAADKLLQHKMWAGLGLQPKDLEGKRVLDVGANDGFFTIACLLAGASSVTAINTSDWITWPRNITFASEAWGLQPDIVTGDFREHPFEGTFDVILLLGVIYHVEDVFGCIKLLRQLLSPGGSLMIETRISDLDVPVPIFEAASDLYTTSERQGKEALFGRGISNYLLPNIKAMHNLAFSYDFTFTHLEGPDNPYSKDNPHRQMFRFQLA